MQKHVSTRLGRLAAGLLAVALGSCQLAPSLSVLPRVGQLDIEGDVLVSSSIASVASDAEELGFDQDDATFQPRVDLRWGPAHITASGYIADYEGTGTAEGQLDLGGVVIAAGEQVESALDVTSVNLVTTFDLVPTSLVDVGIGIGARVVDFEGQVRSLSSGDSIDSDELFALPVAALRAGVALGPVQLSAIASGLSGSYDDIDATVIDVDVLAEYRFDDFLGFHGSFVAGYRHIGIDVEYTDDGSDVDADLDFTGPYIGLALGI